MMLNIPDQSYFRRRKHGYHREYGRRLVWTYYATSCQSSSTSRMFPKPAVPLCKVLNALRVIHAISEAEMKVNKKVRTQSHSQDISHQILIIAWRTRSQEMSDVTMRVQSTNQSFHHSKVRETIIKFKNDSARLCTRCMFKRYRVI